MPKRLRPFPERIETLLLQCFHCFWSDPTSNIDGVRHHETHQIVQDLLQVRTLFFEFFSDALCFLQCGFVDQHFFRTLVDQC
jgi:hypothetical protein